MSLLLLPVVWLAIVLLGYQLIYWALGVRGWALAFRVSGSSLFTLGIASVDELAVTAAGAAPDESQEVGPGASHPGSIRLS